MKLNQIYNKDCIEYMKTLPDKCIDLVIADPPYFQICGEFDYKWETVDEYVEWCKKWIIEIHRIIKDTGSFYLWGVGGVGSAETT